MKLPPAGERTDSPRNRFTLFLALALVSIAAVWGAATRGPITIDPPFGRTPPEPASHRPPAPLAETPDELLVELPEPLESTPPDLFWLLTIGKWVATLVVIAALVMIALRLIAEYRKPRDAAQPSALDRVHAPTTPEIQPDLSTLESAVHTAQNHLAQDLAPGDAIIAAWVSIEQAAQESGLTKQPWHTTSEFTLWVLSQAPIDQAALHDLMILYHRARFSHHPIQYEDVEQAQALLARILHSWRTV